MIIELIVIGLDNKSLFIFNNITDFLPNYCFIDVFFLLGKKHQDVIVTVRVRVTYHHFHLSLSTMLPLYDIHYHSDRLALLSSQPEKHGCRQSAHHPYSLYPHCSQQECSHSPNCCLEYFLSLRFSSLVHLRQLSKIAYKSSSPASLHPHQVSLAHL